MDKLSLAILAFLSVLMVVSGNYDFCAEGLTKIEKFSLAQELICKLGEFTGIFGAKN